jgi:hypothetical protein
MTSYCSLGPPPTGMKVNKCVAFHMPPMGGSLV